MILISDATPSDVPTIIDIAERSWWKAYGSILHANQIRYMLDTMYAPHVLTKDMRRGTQLFLLASDESQPRAFAAYGKRYEEVGVYKIYKIYVDPDTQGKGFGAALVREIVKRLALQGVPVLELNVNRHNPARTFYEKLGFRVEREEDTPIGPYWMNDYVMRLDLRKFPGDFHV